MRRVVAVTAGTGDIGIEICRALVRADLEPLAIDLEGRETERQKLSAAGVTSASRQAHVTDRRQLEDAIETVEDLVGAVANAGVVESAPFLEVTERQRARQLAVNLTGAFNTAQAVARRLVQNGVRGRLVLVTPWLHARSQDPLLAYSPSKAGPTALIAGTATELPRTASS